MLRPTPGELLAGVRRELREQVLPHVPDGAPARQLRAALHVLGRLERSWDLLPGYLEADNADLRHVLGEVTGRVVSPDPVQRPGDLDIPGVHDPTLRSLMAENARLQAELDQAQQDWRAGRAGGTEVDEVVGTRLHALHARMAERAARAAAVADED